MQRFTDLQVWQRSHQLVLAVYKVFATFPRDERYELTAQLRRAIVSVPTNIAEGCKRRSNAEFAHFLNIAESSLAESDYLLLLARDLGYLAPEASEELRSEAEEISRMLNALHARVKESL
jgi:four helix bundle protein